MRTRTKVSFAIVCALGLVALLGGFVCMQGARVGSEYWKREYLRASAHEVWLLTRVRSIMARGASEADLNWVDRQLRPKRALLDTPSFVEFARGDTTTQEILKEIDALEQKAEGSQAPKHKRNEAGVGERIPGQVSE